MDRLKNKISIVTGAAHGIGKSIAECFAEEGAWVLVVDVDEAGEETAETIRQQGGQAVYFAADIGDPDAVVKAVRQASVETGRIDILCNNAAYLDRFHNALDAPAEEWERCIAVTLMASANFIKAVLPTMVQQQSGSIINISSFQGLVGARNSAAHTAAKHGIIGLTRSVAHDFGAQNIRCNAICPGIIAGRNSPAPDSEQHRRHVGKTMLGRLGLPRDVGMAAVFLASDESAYITGSAIPVDGGWTAM